MLSKPFKCWRNRDDCEPLHSIESFPEDMGEEELFAAMEDGSLEAKTFVCCGCVHDDKRDLAQDAYRCCWKNDFVDEIGDYDEQDLTHMLAVISQGLAIIATRRVNSGTIDVATMQGEGK